MGCLGSGRGPGPPSLSRSPLGVLLMVPSEPVLLKFWLKSSKGKSPGGSKPDLKDSTTMAESLGGGRGETTEVVRNASFQHPAPAVLPERTLRSSTALAADTIPSRHLDTMGMTRRSASAKLRYVSPSFTVRRWSMSCRFYSTTQMVGCQTNQTTSPQTCSSPLFRINNLRIICRLNCSVDEQGRSSPISIPFYISVYISKCAGLK